MSNLKQLIENIANWSTHKTPIDKAFFEDTGIYYSNKYESTNIQYIYHKLWNNLIKLLQDNNIYISDKTNIIEIPKIAWPDFVISIKNIYDNSDKSKTLPELARYVFDIINHELESQNMSLIYISKIEFKGIYINIHTSEKYKNEVLMQISELQDDYGNIYMEWFSDKNVVVEYPSCNTAKAMWVHHVRAMVIWQVWNNILTRTWAKICKWNYLWDWGTPFGKLVYSIQKTWENNPDIYTQIEEKPNEILWQIYADFKSIEDINKEDIARSYFARLESGDLEIVNLWKYIRNLSLVDFQNIFDKFGVYPDCNIWESYAQLFESQVVNDLQNANLLQESDGALIVKFKRENWELIPIYIWEEESENKDSMEIFIIKKSDWSTNYATRDLGLMKLRWQNNTDKIYICTDNWQRLHFQLINILAKKLWYIYEDTFVHIPFGLLLSGGEKMSTRWGKLFRLEDLIQELQDKISQDLWGQNITNLESQNLAIAAIVFNDIKWDINKDLNFDIKAMTNLSWDSGIYLLGTSRRLESLIKKLSDNLIDIDNSDSKIQDICIQNIYDTDKAISDIIIQLSYISEIFSDSIDLVKPHILVQYILSICSNINSWYNNWPKILELDVNSQIAYVYILQNIYICIDNLFKTIGIKK